MKQIIQSLVAKDGKYIVLPVWVSGEKGYGNLVHPNPFANSAVGDTQQQYPHGTKFVDSDRTFFYGKIYDVYTAGKAGVGVFNKNEMDTVTFGATAGVAGDTVIGVLANTMDVDTTPEEDFFAGGWFMPMANPTHTYRILASTTYTGGRTNGEVDLTLDYGLATSISAGTGGCYLNRSEWTKLSQQWAGGFDYATCPGVTPIDCIASTWQWLQSWGPCHVIPYNDEIGGTVNVHGCVFHIDGSIRVETRSPTTFRQLAGYMINSSGVSSSLTWLIRLQVNR